MRLEISIHPWVDGLWVVTVNGEVVCDPLPLEDAKRLAKLWTPRTYKVEI